MEIISFIGENGRKLYAIGPFSEKAQASRAAAGLGKIAAAPRKRPHGPITGRAWDIFDLLGKKLSRAALIAECERQGINKGTAAAQYGRWKASR